ncbi:TetR family transcriptional regulator [Embleya scabrispora]|uniref:TetR family transcriptional regulator n=1 Tax=Embleya scabrispora TaxID=159449 RepID=UPI00037FAC09|nr:TetR family transcriptional regulator [Embleya scabrispora]MYS83312.1 TetR family transcriptional regulator [Streptomyces sp. SID5474]
MTAKESSIPDLPGSPVGLRERKKIKTRQAIRREAYRLFREHGYDATTVDQIAEAAEISPSTFFRYFPTKEDLVLTDEYDPVLVEILRTAPQGTSLVRVVRTGVLDALREILRVDGEELATRMTLVLNVPALRRRTYEQQMQTWVLITEAFAARTGRSANDMELRVAAASINAAMGEAIMGWARNGCTEDLVELVDQALALLETGLRDGP